ncbi:MAG: 50S ribosomal protein L21 [Candidatus Omnitrophota bacterium]|jgi:large subunit ribosomal protein L21|nr:MAG: 50S ribosomal protein L21 [Candidatus Omnitrophota bacterium]
MYAIIEVGAKQYIVKEGDSIEVERQKIEQHKDIILKNILLISNDKETKVGQPFLKDATVKATVVEHTKAEKLISFKYRRRKSSHWTKGHRQRLTRLTIKEIKAS